jgi:hypothetical protein
MGESYITRKGGGGGSGFDYANAAIQDTGGTKYEVYNGFNTINLNPTSPYFTPFNRWVLNNNTTKPIVLTNLTTRINGSFVSPFNLSFTYTAISGVNPVTYVASIFENSASNPKAYGNQRGFYRTFNNFNSFTLMRFYYTNSAYNNTYAHFPQSSIQNTPNWGLGSIQGGHYYDNKLYLYGLANGHNALKLYNMSTNTPSLLTSYNTGNFTQSEINGPYIYYINSVTSNLEKRWLNNLSLVASGTNLVSQIYFLNEGHLYGRSTSGNIIRISEESLQITNQTVNSTPVYGEVGYNKNFLYLCHGSTYQLQKYHKNNLTFISQTPTTGFQNNQHYGVVAEEQNVYTIAQMFSDSNYQIVQLRASDLGRTSWINYNNQNFPRSAFRLFYDQGADVSTFVYASFFSNGTNNNFSFYQVRQPVQTSLYEINQITL